MLRAGVNANLLHAEPDARHRLPIVRLEPTLDAPELKPCNLADVLGEASHRVPGVPEPDQGLGAHGSIYKHLDIGATMTPVTSAGLPAAVARERPPGTPTAPSLAVSP